MHGLVPYNVTGLGVIRNACLKFRIAEIGPSTANPDLQRQGAAGDLDTHVLKLWVPGPGSTGSERAAPGRPRYQTPTVLGADCRSGRGWLLPSIMHAGAASANFTWMNCSPPSVDVITAYQRRKGKVSTLGKNKRFLRD